MKNYDKKLIREIFARSPKTIKSKKECYTLYESGFFGNKPLTWNSYEEIISKGYEGEVTIRSKRGIVRSNTQYNVHIKEIPKKIKQLGEKGILEKNLTFNESMPDENISIQGEIMRSPSGLYLHYSTLKEPMNLALKKQPRNAKGLTAKLLLQNKMSPSSYIMIEEFLEMFPEDIIEFSSWKKNVGTEKKDIIIWEIRNY